MRFPNSLKHEEIDNQDEIYTCIFSKESDLELLKALSTRLSPLFGINLPCKNFEIFCKTIENITLDTCNLMTHDIECRISDLYSLIEKTSKIINRYSQHQFFRTKLKFSTMRINLKITRNDEGFGSKSEISEMFSTIQFSTQDSGSYIKKLEHKIIELEYKLETSAIPDYLTPFPNWEDSLIKLEINPPYHIAIPNDYFHIKKYSILQNKILAEKEFDAFDSKILKAKYNKKIKKLSVKKSKLSETETFLRKKNLELEKQKNDLEKAKESFEVLKNKQSSLNSAKIAALNSFVSELSFFHFSEVEEPSFFSKLVNPDKSTIESELVELSLELRSLESQYNSRRSLNKETLESQIEKIKNRQTALKSLKAIQSLSKPSVSTSSSLLPEKIPKNCFQGPRPDTHETELRRQLRIKEIRLKEKEQEILQHESRTLALWKDNLETSEVIKNALQTLEEFRSCKEKYERRIDFVEKKRLELQDTLSEINKRENGLNDLREQLEADWMDLDLKKKEFGNRVKVLLQFLERN